MRFTRRSLVLAVSLALVVTFARRHALGEALETEELSSILSVVGGLVVAGSLIVAMNRRRSRA